MYFALLLTLNDPNKKEYISMYIENFGKITFGILIVLNIIINSQKIHDGYINNKINIDPIKNLFSDFSQDQNIKFSKIPFVGSGNVSNYFYENQLVCYILEHIINYKVGCN